MTNPNFTATLSTNDLYRDLDTSVCLTDLLDGYDSDIAELQDAVDGLDDTYALSDHTHDEYATVGNISALQSAIASKADENHTHTEYAASSHTHSEYASQSDLDALENEVDGKADSTHTHSEYAASSHSHSEYAAVSHTHADYAAVSHEHSDYATVTALESLSDEVDGKASSTHTHSEYASSSHAHDDRYYTESEVDSKLAAKSDTSHNHDDDYDASGAAASALTSANAYTDAEIANLLNNSTTAVDSIMELAEAMEDNADAITALESIAASKASASDLTSHTGNTTAHITATERTNWNAAKTHADSAHAPSNAQANQNAFSNVTVGSTTIAADTEADTLTLIAGSNVTLTPNATNDGITIAANDTVYTHPTISGNKHIPAGGSSGQILRWSADGTAVWGADNDTTYSAATQSAAGLMSAADKVKLDGIAANANNYTYTLPSAGTSLGGVKSGGDVTISGGLITVNDDSHNHVISNVDGLQDALDGKAASSHSHDDVYYTESEIDEIVSGINTFISGKAASNHTHTISNVTNLQSTLDSKVPTSRTVNGKALTANITLSASDVGADASGTAATQAAAALQSAKDYADDIKDDLLNGAGAAYDTLKELGDLIDVNTDAIDALETVAAGKANASDLTSHVNNKSNPHAVTLAQLGVTATAAELNKLDGVTATTTELNYIDGVTSNIQTQLNSKAASGHTHSAATTSAAGLMSAADKSKLDGIASGANAYTLPAAGSSLGGVKSGGDVTISSGTITVNDDSHNHVISNVDGLQSALDGKAASSHTHNYAGSSSAGGAATSANKLATARTISLTGDVTGSTSFDGSGNVSIAATVADDSHNHVISNVDGLQSALNAKAASDHKHYAQEVTVAGTDLNDYTDAGIYVFAQAYAPVNVPAGTNGWLVVMPWGEGGGTIKQLWFRHGTSGTNDHETYVRTKIANVSTWSPWSKYYTTSNPPTAAEVGATPAFTNSIGGVEYSFNTSDGKNVLDEIASMPQGLHTIYSQGGVSGNPKTTESWRLLVHKTSATIGWVVAFGSSGSVYANYQNEADHFQGWKCIYEATNKMILWNGASYLTSTNGTPQVVTPSKKLSECRTGWLLLWSDYDASTSTANDTDFCTTYIPKYTPTGGTWGGKAFYCSVPTYVGGDASDVSTEIRVIKPVYVHDDKLVGSYQNTTGGRNDVVLRAVYEV